VAERGIIFSPAMVRAILDGRKTQTRRTVKPQPNNADMELMEILGPEGEVHYRRPALHPMLSEVPAHYTVRSYMDGLLARCPYGQVGDHLWVRETHCYAEKNIVGYRADADCGSWMDDGAGGRIWNHHGVILESPAYQSRFENDQRWTTYSLKKYGGRWRPSIHMPRWASRITLEITGVKVELLQSISEEDARSEGVEMGYLPYSAEHRTPPTPVEYRPMFRRLWNEIHGDGAWDLNLWLWCISFRRVKP